MQRLLFQKAFNSQQLVHVTVINLFQLHHLRDFSSETESHSYSQDEQLCWTQLLALFSEYTQWGHRDGRLGVVTGLPHGQPKIRPKDPEGFLKHCQVWHPKTKPK